MKSVTDVLCESIKSSSALEEYKTEGKIVSRLLSKWESLNQIRLRALILCAEITPCGKLDLILGSPGVIRKVFMRIWLYKSKEKKSLITNILLGTNYPLFRELRKV